MIIIRRFFAFFIDYSIILFILISSLLIFRYTPPGIKTYFVLLAITLILFKDIFGRSCGKSIMKLRLVCNERTPTLWKRVVRNISMFIWPVEAIAIVTRSDHRKLMDAILNIDVVTEAK